MRKVAIVADSIACLTPEMVRQYRVTIIPITIHFDGKVYRDGVDITTAEAYQLLAQAPGYFASSPASAGEYASVYRQVARQAESILCITLSSRLSTLYEMARIAQEAARQELPQTAIEVLDSRTVAGGEGLIVYAAARAAAAGGSFAEVTEVARVVRDKVNVIGIMETVRHVYRTGRTPKIVARVGSMLNIKPVFTVSEGVVRIAGLARSKEQAVRRALAMMRERVGDRPVHVSVAHANAVDEGEQLMKRISAEFDCVDLWLADFSPVMGYVTGSGVLGLAFYTDAGGPA